MNLLNGGGGGHPGSTTAAQSEDQSSVVRMSSAALESTHSTVLEDSFSRENNGAADFICWICRFQVNDPVTCSNGHLFCRDCVSRWIQPLVGVSQSCSSLNGSVLDLTSSSSQKPYCPTCRVTLRVEDLKSILGAADGEHLADAGCSVSSKQHRRTSQRNIRLSRFDSLRHSYEAEIEHLLCQVDRLEEELDLCRNGCQQKYSRSVQTDVPHPSTSDILERALKFANDLKSENEQLRKVNEDLEMAKLNLSRELKLCMEDRNGGGGAGAGVTGTPQKYGKLVITTQQREIEDLKKERNQLKKAMDRQDGYIKELENKVAPTKPLPRPSKGAESQGRENTDTSTGTITHHNLSSSHASVTSQSSSSCLANLSLPSPFRKINLNSAQKCDQSNHRNVSSDTSQGDSDVVCSSKESSDKLMLSSSSPSQTKRALNFSKDQEFLKGDSVSLSQPTECQDIGVKSKSNETSRLSRSGFESSNCGVRSEKTKSPSSSKIPRPRSQSPAQCSNGVRRSPRKLGNMEFEANKVQFEAKSAKDVPVFGATGHQIEEADEKRSSISIGLKQNNLKLETNTEGSGREQETVVETSRPEVPLNGVERVSPVFQSSCYSKSKLSTNADGVEQPIAPSLCPQLERETSDIPMQSRDAIVEKTSFDDPRLQHSPASNRSSEDIDLDEIFCSTQRRVQTRAASKNNSATTSDSIHVNQSYPWKSNVSSISASSSSFRTNTGIGLGEIQPVAVFDNAAQEKKTGAGLKLDLTLGSLNTFESLLSPLSPLSHQKTSTSVLRSELKPAQEMNPSEVRGSKGPTTSSPEYGFIASLSNTSILSSSSCDQHESSGSGKSKYLKEIDETLAEITKLKGQSIKSLASASKHSASPQKPSTPQKSGSQDFSNCVVSLTPRSNSKRKFQEVNSNLN